jgi:hypothetical protein
MNRAKKSISTFLYAIFGLQEAERKERGTEPTGSGLCESMQRADDWP